MLPRYCRTIIPIAILSFITVVIGRKTHEIEMFVNFIRSTDLEFRQLKWGGSVVIDA